MFSRLSRCLSTAGSGNSTTAGFRRTMPTAARTTPTAYMRTPLKISLMNLSGARMPETSIIIRTYNEERHLPELFRCFAEQEYRSFETVVVDSGSIDRTRDIASAYADRLISIRKHDFSFGYSLNEGIRNSTSRFVALVSAQVLAADSIWLGDLVLTLRGPTNTIGSIMP